MGPAAAGVGPTRHRVAALQRRVHRNDDLQPALMNAGTATSETAGLTLAFSGCSGGVPRPHSGSYTATGTVTMAGANACANWLVPPPGTSPLVNFTPSSADGHCDLVPRHYQPLHRELLQVALRDRRARPHRRQTAGAGSVVSGSYAPTANLLLRIRQTWASVASSCANSNVPSLTIVPSNPATAISQGTW